MPDTARTPSLEIPEPNSHKRRRSALNRDCRQQLGALFEQDVNRDGVFVRHTHLDRCCGVSQAANHHELRSSGHASEGKASDRIRSRLNPDLADAHVRIADRGLCFIGYAADDCTLSMSGARREQQRHATSGEVCIAEHSRMPEGVR
jgi:hypothetical protein